MNLQTIKEQESWEEELRTRVIYLVDNEGEIDESVWSSFVDFIRSQIDLAYKVGKEDAFLIGYKKGEEIQIPWEYLDSENKEDLLKKLKLFNL